MKQNQMARGVVSAQEALIPLKNIPWHELIITIGGLLGGRRKKRKYVAELNAALQEVLLAQAQLQILVDSLGEWQRYGLLVKKAQEAQSWTTKEAVSLADFVAEKTAQSYAMIQRFGHALTRGIATCERIIHDRGLQQEAAQHGVLLRLGAAQAALKELQDTKA